MANKTGKKQGGDNKTATAKKTTAKKSAKKKPASFSRNAAVKAAPKKAPAKKETVKKEVVKKEVVKKETSDFSEFETLKLGEVEKLDSKIILRDVARETPIEPIKPAAQPTTKPETKSAPIARPVASKPTAKEIKEQEISKAIKTAAKLPEARTTKRKRSAFGDFGLKRVVLATACVATAVFAIVYFVNITSTDMSLKVAAMQSGIDAAYPAYVPRGFSLSDVTSGTGKVSMHFKNGEESFGLTEEVSNWDSTALLNNYIKPTYNNDYTVVREQGLTLYMGNDWEAWVNGGVLYKLTVDSGELTKKQMKSIATSL